MSFNNFLSGLKEKAGELKTQVMQFKNKTFLEAATAGSALIAMADGSVSSDEKKKMIKLIENNEALSVFKTSDVITSFSEHISNLEFDKDVGESKAYEALRKLKGKDIESRTVLRLIIAIASSDGDFDDDEKSSARKIATELGLPHSEFEL